MVSRVGIALPTYRRVTYLRQALESVLAQTYGDFALLVSDNGNEGEVREIVDSYRDPRLRYVGQPSNIGSQRNVLAALACVPGELLAILHDDDLWEPEFLAEMVSPLLADPSLAVAFCDHWLIDGTGARDARATAATTRASGRERLPGGLVSPFQREALFGAVQMSYAAVFRRSAMDLATVSEEVDPLYDLYMAYLLARDGAAAWYVPRRLTSYRMHDAQMTVQVGWERQRLRCYEMFASDERLAQLRPEIEARLGVFQVRTGRRLLVSGQLAEGRRLLRAGRRRAMRGRATAALVGSYVPAAPALVRAALRLGLVESQA